MKTEPEVMEEQALTRGELAKQSGKKFETIRFYENKGLIHPAYRDSSNYRRFAASDSQRLQFIDKAKGLGFTLKEIAEILDIHDNEESACQTLGEKAKQKHAEIEQQIADLQAKKATLEKLTGCEALELDSCNCDILANASRLEEGCDCCED